MNRKLIPALLWFGAVLAAQHIPTITFVSNAEGGNPQIAPNTWVEIDAMNLATAGDARIWQGSDFANGQMPAALDGVSVTVGGKNAYIYYISPTQVNVLTPPDAMPGTVMVQLTRDSLSSAPFPVQAGPLSPSFFIFGGGPYVAAVHADGSLLAPAGLFPGTVTTPAKSGEIVQLYANGFGPTSTPVVNGSISQSGSLTPLPAVTIGGVSAVVQFAGLVEPGEFQFNVVIPLDAPSGDDALVATYNGAETAPAAVITVEGSAPAPSSLTFYVAPNGNDFWSGRLPAPNPAQTDGPLASFDRARALVQAISKTGLSQVNVQFRGGTYYLSSTKMLTAADSGSASLRIVYQNYPGETPVFSGGMRVQNWTNAGGGVRKVTLPAAAQYFDNLFYNGARRLRPRLGGALGAYYRYVGPVYSNAAGPPSAAPDAGCHVYFPGTGWQCYDRFQYQPSDPITDTWKNLAPPAGNPCGQPARNPALVGDIEIVNFEQYSVSKLRVSCVDTTTHIVYLTGNTATEADHPTAHGFIPGHRYLVENVQDQLTQPGQWFLDHSITPWTLTYLANPGENPNTDTVIVPQLAQLLVASNLQYVTFQGLTFEHDNYTLPAQGYDGESEIIAAVTSRTRDTSRSIRAWLPKSPARAWSSSRASTTLRRHGAFPPGRMRPHPTTSSGTARSTMWARARFASAHREIRRIPMPTSRNSTPCKIPWWKAMGGSTRVPKASRKARGTTTSTRTTTSTMDTKARSKSVTAPTPTSIRLLRTITSFRSITFTTSFKGS